MHTVNTGGFHIEKQTPTEIDDFSLSVTITMIHHLHCLSHRQYEIARLKVFHCVVFIFFEFLICRGKREMFSARFSEMRDM